MDKGSLNHVRLIGRLGQDPDVRATTAGFMAANFSLATTASKQVPNTQPPQYEDVTEWHRCTCTGKKAELMQKVGKGAMLHVEGALSTRKYTDRDQQERSITEIKVKTITILVWPPRQDNGGTQQGGGYNQNQGGGGYNQNQGGGGYNQNSGGTGNPQGGGGNPFGGDDEPLPF